MKKDTLSLNRLKKLLIPLLVFLLPTQLAYHFWPPSSFVFGIRVDYLAPAVYLTDLIILFLLLAYAVQEKLRLWTFISKYKLQILVTFVFILVNVVFASSPTTAIFKWLKVLELVGLALYLRFKMSETNKDQIYNTLFYSLVFVSVIGISQFFIGRTIGGAFYLFGERSFDISTPAVALTQINGHEFLRAYSVFSHPNSLSGYLGASLLFLLMANYFKRKPIHIVGFLIIIACLTLTFSLSGIVSLIIVLPFILVNKKLKTISNFKIPIFFGLVAFSLALPVVGDRILVYTKDLGSPTTERINLSIISGKIIKQKFLIGGGLGNFTAMVPHYGGLVSGPWLLQPVHNIFLLAFSETGLAGFVILFLAFYKGIRTKHFPIFLFILITGVFDHYWLTLQQNMLLLALMFGMVSYLGHSEAEW